MWESTPEEKFKSKTTYETEQGFSKNQSKDFLLIKLSHTTSLSII